MFFRMLWHDLRDKKGLNIILLLFMLTASALVFISAAQVYSTLSGRSRTNEICRNADGALIYSYGANNREAVRAEIDRVLSETSLAASCIRQRRVPIQAEGIDFPDFEESESNAFLNSSSYLAPQPAESNLVYGLEDEPFYLKNGQIAVPLNLQIITGAEIGDKIRLTTALGNIYEFEITQFYKRTDGTTRYLITEADYEVLLNDFPVQQDVLQIKLTENNEENMLALYSEMTKKTGRGFGLIYYDNTTMDSTFTSIIAVIMTAVSIFMILLILMTIRFTIIAALKDEEKGIGMMRAIGVDSVKFRWLFAAKFIAFAVIGGVIGSLIGFPLSKRVILEFSPNLINPADSALILIGVAAVLLIAGVMILFSLSVMGRMKRVSIMRVIHGENHGEQFGKTTKLHLSKRKKMPVPLYLAVSDVFSRLKRYLFLIISYTLGAGIVLLIVSMRYSMHSTNYLRYDMTSNLDFHLSLTKSQRKPYSDRERYEGIPLWVQLNDEIQEAGIPAHVSFYYSDWRQLMLGNESKDCYVAYNLPDTSMLIFREGKMPEAADECAISGYTADAYGITIGSEIQLAEYDPNGLEQEPETFRVTGIVSYMELGCPMTVMSAAFQPKNKPTYPTSIYAKTIDSDDKDAVLDMLRAHFGEKQVKTPETYMESYLGEYGTIVTTAMYAVTVTVMIILALMTVLYLNIFLGEDKPEIALLKALGFSDGAIYASQLLRMVILLVISLIAAIILTKTVGLALVRLMIGIYVGLTGFIFEPMTLFTYLILPLMIGAVVLLPTLLRLRSVRSMDIRSISEE